MAHVAQYKKDTVEKVVGLIQQYPIIGLLNMENLPAAQLQVMKEKLRGKVEIFMTKKRLFNIAIQEAAKTKKGIEQLINSFKGMPALIFTKDNPFSLYKAIKKSKSEAPARPGQTAPKDIIIKAGPTPFAPGPIISELSAFKLKTKVEGGKVAITQDTVVCKEGEAINDKLASLLLRLDIKPMEIGLDLHTVYENGELLTKQVLDIDETKFAENLASAARWALNLSVEISYPTKDTIEILLGNSFREAKAVAVESNFMADLVKEDVLAKAERQMKALKEAAGIAIPEKKAEEEKKAEATQKPAAEESKAGEKKQEKAAEQPQEKKQSELPPQKAAEKSKVQEAIEKTHQAEKKIEQHVQQVITKEEQTVKTVPETVQKEQKVAQKAEELLKAVEQEIQQAKQTEQKKDATIEKEQKKIEELTKQLMKKGTLR